MNNLSDNLERDLNNNLDLLGDNSDPIVFFAKCHGAGEIEAQNLYRHFMNIHEAREKNFIRFINENEILKANPSLKQLFVEEPDLFLFYASECNDNLYALFEDEEIAEMPALSELINQIIKRENKGIQKIFSADFLRVLSGLSREEILATLGQIKNQTFNQCVTPSFLRLITILGETEHKTLSAQELEILLRCLIRGIARINPLLGDAHFPMSLVSFEYIGDIIHYAREMNWAKDVFDRFSKLDESLLKDHIAFIRESTLQILHNRFGSRAAAHYFEELSKGDEYFLIKVLFMMSLGAFSRDQWIQYVTDFLRNEYYEKRVINENGGWTSNTSPFDEVMGNFINAVLKSFMGNEKIDFEAIAAMIQHPDYDSSDESDEGSSLDDSAEE